MATPRGEVLCVNVYYVILKGHTSRTDIERCVLFVGILMMGVLWMIITGDDTVFSTNVGWLKTTIIL